MELSSSPRRSSRSPAIRHVVDSSCRKLKELTMRNLATAMVEELLEELMATEEVVVMMMIGAAAATVEVAMTNSLNSLLVYWLDSRYLSMTERNPVRTKAITAAILNFLGDFFCQLVIEKDGKLDVKQTAVITFLGLVLVGLMLHIWYLTLSKVFTAMGVKGTVIWLLLDQVVFLSFPPSQIFQNVLQDWKPAVIANCKLWVPFQFINFLVVPQPLQVAFANVVALAWNIYLSFASHTEVYTAPQTSPVVTEMSAPGDQKD